MPKSGTVLSMTRCIYLPKQACKAEPVVNFDYCVQHLNTSRGLQHMVDRVRNGHVLVQSDIDSVIAKHTQIPEKDYQTTALEKMVELIDRTLDFEQHTQRMLSNLDPDDWRYTDRAGQEQLRSEVVLYERAMERNVRALSAVSKMAIQDKVVALGKAQTELMIRVLMSVVMDLRLPNDQVKLAQSLLLEKLRAEANLTPRTEHHVAEILSGPPVVDGEVLDEDG